MYPVSNDFPTAVKANTGKYYWTGKNTAKGGTMYDFSRDDIVKGSRHITSQCCGSTEIEMKSFNGLEICMPEEDKDRI